MEMEHEVHAAHSGNAENEEKRLESVDESKKTQVGGG